MQQVAPAANSMTFPCRFRSVALATLLILLAPSSVLAERGAYRVEVLVFSHQGAAAEPRAVETISDYPDAWRLSPDLPRPVVLAEDPAPLGVMSDMMRGAWRRLEDSGAYQPLLFRAWEQSRIDHHPPVRLHDDEVLAHRYAWPAGEAYVDLASADLFAPYRRQYFRLDGTAQLRRTRFLHLEFDLEFRHELLAPEPFAASPGTLAAPPPSGMPSPAPLRSSENGSSGDHGSEPAALVYRLAESRQVRTGEVLYFDTPFLAVLARVTETAGE